jgi:hypothetical protein
MSSKKQGFLSWSGTLSHEIATYIKDEILDSLFGDSIEPFISSEIGVGNLSTEEIFTRLTKNENRFQMSDLSSDEKTASIGKAANADWVVRGKVQKLGTRIVVTASLLDVNTLEIVGGAPMYLNDIEEAAVKMNDFIATITSRITGGGRVYRGGMRNEILLLGITFIA